MAFKEKYVAKLLADLGGRCAVCDAAHDVQVQYILPPQQGGTDRIDNAITLCSDCDSEVHGVRPNRQYIPEELKVHRTRSIERVRREAKWSPGSKAWQLDKTLILFYAQCLDKSSFRAPFEAETSFAAFDTAMEEVLIGLNTGYWRMTNGKLIERAKGKSYLVHRPWRERVDQIAYTIDEIRRRLREAFGLEGLLTLYRNIRDYEIEIERRMAEEFRQDRSLLDWIDAQRQVTLDNMNSMLKQIGHEPLRGINAAARS